MIEPYFVVNLLGIRFVCNVRIANGKLPAESDQNRENRESHDDAMRTIGQINGVQRELWVANEHEEQNQANQWANQQQQPEE